MGIIQSRHVANNFGSSRLSSKFANTNKARRSSFCHGGHGAPQICDLIIAPSGVGSGHCRHPQGTPVWWDIPTGKGRAEWGSDVVSQMSGWSCANERFLPKVSRTVSCGGLEQGNTIHLNHCKAFQPYQKRIGVTSGEILAASAGAFTGRSG